LATPPTPTAEDIVASKLRQFGKNRRELVHALAKRFNIGVPDEVERFFDAVEGGRWEEIDAAHQALLRGADLNFPRAEVHQIWRPIQETWGIAREAHNWPAQKILDYGEAVLGSLRPGMIYMGGTDPGCFIPTFLNQTSEGDRHVVLTQNALADQTYLDYVNFLYGDRLATLTKDDSQRAFRDYLTDYQKRLTHDAQFPHEPKQVRPVENISGVEPGEGVAIDPDKVNASGVDAVMAINERLLKKFMEKNPDASFAMEVSFTFPSIYAEASPLGPVLELRVQDAQNALTRERATESVDYWRATAKALLSDSEAADSLYTRLAYAKLAAEQADLLLKRGYSTEAEQTLRLANEIGPGSPEAIFHLLNLLKAQGRVEDALSAAENALRGLPSEERLQPIFGNKPGRGAQLRNAIEELRRLQRSKP
jgi:tetratricopeptide (TPR) repeat protein